ncbi:MAG: hypothetical protein WBF58_08355 [Xanthobacteraceae bacterium]
MLRPLHIVIAGLDPAIHDAVAHNLLGYFEARPIGMDARVKPAHDE